MANEDASGKKKKDIRSILEQAKTEVDNKVVAREKAELKPKKAKDVFVNNPPRSFTKGGMPADSQNRVYMRASLIDFIFGMLVGVVGTLILKQVL